MEACRQVKVVDRYLAQLLTRGTPPDGPSVSGCAVIGGPSAHLSMAAR